MRLGVIGTGHLGQHHARIYRGMAGVALAGIVDTDPRRRFEVATLTGAQAFADWRELLGRVDAVSVVVPTTLHREIALPFIEAGVHVLVEKPIAATVEDASSLVDAARRKNVVLQVGHIERFNQAIRAAERFISDPRYVVADRLAPYSFRSKDIGVVLDLMVHDLDILLEFVKDPVARAEGLGVPVLSRSEDIADARLTFSSGCVADLRASRISLKRMRKIRFFQRTAYVSIDYDSRRVSVFRRSRAVEEGEIDPSKLDPRDLADPQGFVFSSLLDHEEFEMGKGEDALTAELASFIEACRGEHAPVVPGEHGLRAVEVALRIQREIEEYVAREATRAGIPMPDMALRAARGLADARSARLDEDGDEAARPREEELGAESS
ncbi:Gfo/Idh/MocA family oxidoreductase [bacterium]|nr:Gfo/Idh/MocA family oxidoreductase [bacterium]